MEIPCSSSFESHSGFDLEIGLGLSSYSRSMALAAASRSFPNRHNRHFLDSCSLCTKLLGADHDIYMYMGNTPFCSEECRTKQIEIDEANERRRRMQRKKVQAEDNNNKKSCSSSSKSNDLYIKVTIAS